MITKIKIFLILLLIALITACSSKNSNPKMLEKLLGLWLISKGNETKPIIEEDPCSGVNSLTIYTREANLKLALSSGSCTVRVKNDTSLVLKKDISKTSERNLDIPLLADGKYIAEFAKLGTKEKVTEVVIIKDTILDKPAITPAGILQNKISGFYETTVSAVIVNITVQESLQSLKCDGIEYVNTSMREGKNSVFNITVSSEVKLDCMAVDLAGNIGTIPTLNIKKVSESPYLESNLPSQYQVFDIEVVESCLKGNLAEIEIRANGIPLATTIKNDGSICVSIKVPFSSGTTEVVVNGKNIVGNAYKLTHYIVQLRDIQSPIITSNGIGSVKVSKLETATGTTTNIFIGTKLLTTFSEAEKNIDVSKFPIGTSILMTVNVRDGYSSVNAYNFVYQRWFPKDTDVDSKYLNDFIGNYLPLDEVFTQTGIEANANYNVVSGRPFLLVTIKSPLGFSDSVQCTISGKTKSTWKNYRQGGSFSEEYNTTFIVGYRLKNFSKKSYDPVVKAEGSEQVPVKLIVTPENVSNNQIVLMVEGGTNEKTQTGDYWYAWRNYNRCSPPTGSSKISCPYGGGSFNDEQGFFCGQYTANCSELQWVVSANKITLPVTEPAFLICE
ncbi:MAG: hypothetical protein KA146_02400 [Leptospiraceae bacterium]|nr:hypothetical protein [Leptospiraceae bacterium]